MNDEQFNSEFVKRFGSASYAPPMQAPDRVSSASTVYPPQFQISPMWVMIAMTFALAVWAVLREDSAQNQTATTSSLVRVEAIETRLSAVESVVPKMAKIEQSMVGVLGSVSRIEKDFAYVSEFMRTPRFSASDYEANTRPLIREVERHRDLLDDFRDLKDKTNSRLTELEAKAHSLSQYPKR